VNQLYLDTARMLVQVAPFVFTDDALALKGGTAINLFTRDMPRLSVDLDLVFTDPMVPREQALRRINDAIRQASERLSRSGFQTRATTAAGAGETKLLVRRGSIEVKIEVNFVLRGTVRPVRLASLTPRARETLLADLEIPVASLEDLYGGKLVAALDRQHPRDLFDVLQLFENEGITNGIRRAFVVYLASHTRPVHEVLYPRLRDVTRDYENNFVGMTTAPVTLEELITTRERMLVQLHRDLDTNERQFLLSLVTLAPDWTLLDIPNVDQLPAIRWKLQNLEHLQRSNPRKFQEQSRSLTQHLMQ
jgi:hypothetical protein